MPLSGGTDVGAADNWMMPDWPGLVGVAAMSFCTMAATVVSAANVNCSAFEGAVTVAPSKRATFEPGGIVTKTPWVLRLPPRSVTAGSASVPAVPAKVAQVVPAGTFAELTAPPTAMPVPDDTDAARVPFVVVNAMLVIEA